MREVTNKEELVFVMKEFNKNIQFMMETQRDILRISKNLPEVTKPIERPIEVGEERRVKHIFQSTIGAL